MAVSTAGEARSTVWPSPAAGDGIAEGSFLLVQI